MVPLVHLRHPGSSCTSIDPHLLPIYATSERAPAVSRHRDSSDDLDDAPRIFALERLVEIEHADELVARVRGLADQQPEIHQCEHDVADVSGGAHAPVL